MVIEEKASKYIYRPKPLQRETKDDQLMKVIGETEKQKQANLIKCTWF